MAPILTFWTRLVYVFDYLLGYQDPNVLAVGRTQIPLHEVSKVQPVEPAAPKYPIFNPPDELQPLPFRCEYPDYRAEDGWVSCNTNNDRGCWLKNTKTKQRFDITIDYENNGPRGIDRFYTLEIDYSTLNADTFGDVPVQLFNGSFPGPRLQGCWGDRLHITIINKLKRNVTAGHTGNGTTIHWHGFRQLNTFPMDGVNAITQCPIAPGDQFTYVFNATQYGTSWYHSHYSLQYAAGALGAFTIYGPMAGNFDHQLEPIIMSDWLHDSVFAKWERTLQHPGRIFIDNILQSGKGHWPPLNTSTSTGELSIPEGTTFNEVYFQKGVKYLMRLINGAADTTFVFSIDNHKFKVVSMDFVSIEPYETTHLVVGIGQRYNIIVEANPLEYSDHQNFWMRTTPSPNCTAFNSSQPQPDDHTGIVRYSFNEDYPSSRRHNFTPTCADETYYRNLTPVVQWNVSKTDIMKMDPFYLTFQGNKQGFPYYPCEKSTAKFELIPNNPMWLNFSDPTSLNLDQDFSKRPWLAEVNTGDVDETKWVLLTIISGAKREGNPSKPHPIPKKPGIYVPGQHPIHLHGHDFAVLDQCIPMKETEECDVEKAQLQYVNPPRRDVAFLPDNGYLIIAFKADNPGIWIMHCHIAFHASMGLAAQILENRNKINLPFGWDEPFQAMCQAWDKSGLVNASDPCGLFNPNIIPLQTDSGI